MCTCQVPLAASQQDNSSAGAPQRAAPAWRLAPDCDLYESNDEYLLVIDMPGASPESLSVELTGNQLAIRAQRAPSVEGTDVASISFERRIELPASVDGNSTSAQLQGGVLRVQIAKAAFARRVKIPIAQD
jgi:HSP20 family protein